MRNKKKCWQKERRKENWFLFQQTLNWPFFMIVQNENGQKNVKNNMKTFILDNKYPSGIVFFFNFD